MFTKPLFIFAFFAAIAFFALGFQSAMSDEYDESATAGLVLIGAFMFFFGFVTFFVNRDLMKTRRDHEKELQEFRNEVRTKYLKRVPRP